MENLHPATVTALQLRPRAKSKDKILDKELYIIITAEGGFSGDIDQAGSSYAWTIQCR